MENEKKRFDNWECVDCNNCEKYWLNQCDGVKVSAEAQNRPCKEFLAVRRVVIPQQIKMLQKELNLLRWSVLILAVVLLIHQWV